MSAIIDRVWVLSQVGQEASRGRGARVQRELIGHVNQCGEWNRGRDAGEAEGRSRAR